MAALENNFEVVLLRRITAFTDELRPTAAQIRSQGISIPPEPARKSLAFYAVWLDASDNVLDDAGEYTITPHRIGLRPNGSEVSVTGTSTAGLFARQDYILDNTQNAPALTFQLTAMTAPGSAAAFELYIRAES